MIHIQTGINNGNAGTGAGVALGPGDIGANHFPGGRHQRVGDLLLIQHTGIVAVLNQYLFHAGQGGNLRNLAVGHMGGNHMGRQCQVPDHVQCIAMKDLLRNGVFHFHLLFLQRGPVVHCTGIAGGHLIRGKALFQCGGILQNDGDTDLVRICVALRQILCRKFLPEGRRRGKSAVVNFFPEERVCLPGLGMVFGRHGRNHGTEHHYHCQQHGPEPSVEMGKMHKIILSFFCKNRVWLRLCASLPGVHSAKTNVHIIARTGDKCNPKAPTCNEIVIMLENNGKSMEWMGVLSKTRAVQKYRNPWLLAGRL